MDSMQKEIAEMFKEKPKAFFFLCQYIEYIHGIDDLVDEPKNFELIRKVTQLSAIVFNCEYWKEYSNALYLVERIAHNTYFDSVVWENTLVDKGQTNWKLRDSKVLNQCGYNIIFAVILIEFGEKKLEEFSLKFRNYSHLNQNHDKL